MKNKLLRRLSAIQFAMWETHMYLDTHPRDTTATEMFNNYKKKYEIVKKEYEDAFGPLTLNGVNSDEWLCDPWPWDNEFNTK